MNKTIRWLGNLLVIVGIGLLIWQFSGTKKTERVRDAQLDAFASLKAEADGQKVSQPITMPEQDGSAESGEVTIGDVQGVLSIPQIDIQAPVTYGVTPSILDEGFGAIPDMGRPGEENGSYAIAGHQSHVFGLFFNRLDELEKGSQFNLETMDDNQTYEVYDMKIVEPEEVDVLAKEEGISKLSLITCYPKNSDKHRLVVQAKRVEPQDTSTK